MLTPAIEDLRIIQEKVKVLEVEITRLNELVDQYTPVDLRDKIEAIFTPHQ